MRVGGFARKFAGILRGETRVRSQCIRYHEQICESLQRERILDLVRKRAQLECYPVNMFLNSNGTVIDCPILKITRVTIGSKLGNCRK